MASRGMLDLQRSAIPRIGGSEAPLSSKQHVTGPTVGPFASPMEPLARPHAVDASKDEQAPVLRWVG
eukprot:4711390-Alexandrium_andersonii.AAC.1